MQSTRLVAAEDEPMEMGTIRIDPAAVPDSDYDLACRVLYASISRAMADPALRREYEEWRAERIAAAAAKERS